MRILSKALVLFWAAILLVSSTCFGADVHYCKGEVQSFAVFDTAKPCKMHKKKVEKKVRKCCMAQKKVQQEPRIGFPVLKNGKCCYNDQVSFQTDAESSQSSVDELASDQVEINYFATAHPSNVWGQVATTTPPFRGPPDRQITINYQVFFQVFRV